MRGRFANDRSRLVCEKFPVDGHRMDALKVKVPLNPKPKITSKKARKIWLSLPTAGTNGLPDAACQTS